MFDALKFDVAMVTEEGFERLATPVHYAYSWRHEAEPADEKQEKKLADDFLAALLTQLVTHENEFTDYLPGYVNQAIDFAGDDMGSDEAMGGVLLDILIVIIAFIFAVTISNTIAREAKTIRTLRWWEMRWAIRCLSMLWFPCTTTATVCPCTSRGGTPGHFSKPH